MQPDIFLNGGEMLSNGLFDLKVIWTPGHSPGHICLYEQSQKLLFCGDHILSVITPNISLPPASDSNPLDDFIKSLHTVRNLSVNYVLPAHESIFSNLSKRVDEILQHHEVRNTEILQALQTTAMTAYQISHLIKWMPEFGGVKFNDLKTWDKRAAVSETLAHLKAMNVHGKVNSERQDSLIYYLRK
jgi:glyoxylase-like metal-dependent hydrolase (beta-lactamase superfamily II)